MRCRRLLFLLRCRLLSWFSFTHWAWIDIRCRNTVTQSDTLFVVWIFLWHHTNALGYWSFQRRPLCWLLDNFSWRRWLYLIFGVLEILPNLLNALIKITSEVTSLSNLLAYFHSNLLIWTTVNTGLWSLQLIENSTVIIFALTCTNKIRNGWNPKAPASGLVWIVVGRANHLLIECLLAHDIEETHPLPTQGFGQHDYTPIVTVGFSTDLTQLAIQGLLSASIAISECVSLLPLWRLDICETWRLAANHHFII